MRAFLLICTTHTVPISKLKKGGPHPIANLHNCFCKHCKLGCKSIANSISVWSVKSGPGGGNTSPPKPHTPSLYSNPDLVLCTAFNVRAGGGGLDRTVAGPFFSHPQNTPGRGAPKPAGNQLSPKNASHVVAPIFKKKNHWRGNAANYRIICSKFQIMQEANCS